MGGHQDDDLPRASFHDRVSNADAYESPGWRRMQSRGQQAKAGQRGVAQSIGKHPTVIDAKAVVAFAIGDRVFHKKFGYGEVMEIEGDKLAIEFDHSGLKKLVAGFVLPAEKASDVPF
jgi:DNA helicase-2/ATP-dependent DNA helicase PcrA